MSIKSDWDKSVEGWQSLPIMWKAILLFSLFANISAITSISDTVVEWKSFFRTGIDFYRDMTSPVLAMLNSFFGVTLEQIFIDVLILYGFLCLVFARTISIYRGSWRNILLALAPVGSGFLGSLAYALFAYTEDVRSGFFLFAWFVLIPLVIPFSMLFVLLFDEPARPVAIIYFAQLLFVFLVICIAAAINSGLTA